MTCERDADVGGGGGFTDAAFAGGDDDDAWGGTCELGFAIVLEDRFDGFIIIAMEVGFKGVGYGNGRRERGGGRRRFQG